jgi:hypothetical protein
MFDMANNSKPPRLGIIQKVYVYSQGGGALLGNGWVLTRDDGRQAAPDLFDIKGNKLPEGWYTLQVVGEQHIVVIPRMVQ